ncbi:MAG: hypothetical protein ACK5Y2_01610 [Bdellovibrionales bacterium]
MVKVILGTLVVSLSLSGCGKAPSSRPASKKANDEATQNPPANPGPGTQEGLPAPDVASPETPPLVVGLGRPRLDSAKSPQSSPTPTAESATSDSSRSGDTSNDRDRLDQAGTETLPVTQSIQAPQAVEATKPAPAPEPSDSKGGLTLAAGSNPSPSASEDAREMPEELKERIRQEGRVTLNKLTEQAKAAEKSDMKRPQAGSAEADWQKVLSFVSETGMEDSAAQGMEQFISVDDYSSEDRTRPYNRKMISLVGGLDGKGNFGFNRIHATDEDWARSPEGHDVGKVYMFLVGRDRSLAKFWLKRLVKHSTGSGAVLEDRYLDLSDAEAQARWQLNRQYWIQRALKRP